MFLELGRIDVPCAERGHEAGERQVGLGELNRLDTGARRLGLLRRCAHKTTRGSNTLPERRTAYPPSSLLPYTNHRVVRRQR